MPRSRLPYPLEVRNQIIELVRAGRTPAELAQEFEPTAPTMSNWVAQADRDDGQRQGGLTSAEREALRKLRRENRQLRQEREMLAKAAAWCAQQTHSIPNRSSRLSRRIRPSIASLSGVVCWVSPPAATMPGDIASPGLVRDRRRS
jgi:transposase